MPILFFTFSFSWSWLRVLIKQLIFSIKIDNGVVVLNYVHFINTFSPYVQPVDLCVHLGHSSCNSINIFSSLKKLCFRSVTSLVFSHVSSEILNHYDILHLTHSTWTLYKNVFWKYDIDAWGQKNNWRIWKLKCFAGSLIPIEYSEHLLGEYIWCLFASWGIELIYSVALCPCTMYTQRSSTTGKGRLCQF